MTEPDKKGIKKHYQDEINRLESEPKQTYTAEEYKTLQNNAVKLTIALTIAAAFTGAAMQIKMSNHDANPHHDLTEGGQITITVGSGDSTRIDTVRYTKGAKLPVLIPGEYK